MAGNDQNIDQITLNIDASMSPDHFKCKIKNTTPLKNLMLIFCNHINWPISLLRFRCKGNFVKETDTPYGVLFGPKGQC